MKKCKFFWCLILFLISFSFTSKVEALPLLGEYKVKVGFLLTDFKSSLQYDRANLQGTNLNLGSDMNLENNTVVPFVEGWFGSFIVFNVGYMDSKYEGDARTASAINYNGMTLSNGAGTKQITSDITFRTFHFAAQFSFLNNQTIRASAIAGGMYFAFKSRLSNVTDSIVISKEIAVPLPFVGAEIEIGLMKNLSIRARLRGSSYEMPAVNIGHGEFIDLELGVSFNFTDMISLMAEYRYTSIRLQKNDSARSDRFVNAIDSLMFSVVIRI